jgi:hypothetical protein
MVDKSSEILVNFRRSGNTFTNEKQGNLEQMKSRKFLLPFGRDSFVLQSAF